jgi:hypothetical protein
VLIEVFCGRHGVVFGRWIDASVRRSWPPVDVLVAGATLSDRLKARETVAVLDKQLPGKITKVHSNLERT